MLLRAVSSSSGGTGGGGEDNEKNSGHPKMPEFFECPTIVPEKYISTYHGGALSK